MNLIRHGQSHLNVVFNETREDPGIVDPGLTDEGERQAEAVAEILLERDVRRILASPYSRTLHTAEIIAGRLGLGVTVEPLVRERTFFLCAIGAPRSRLAGRWPGFEFGDRPARGWESPGGVGHQAGIDVDHGRKVGLIGPKTRGGKVEHGRGAGTPDGGADRLRVQEVDTGQVPRLHLVPVDRQTRFGVGVIGATRMEYARVISLVDHVARAVSRALAEASA